MSIRRATQDVNSPTRVPKQLVIIGVLTGIALGSLGSVAFVVWSDSGVSKSTSSESIAGIQAPKSTQETRVQNERTPKVPTVSEVDSVVEFVTELDQLSNEQIAEQVRQTHDLEPQSQPSSIQTILIGELSRRDPKFALEQVWTLPRHQWKELIAFVFSEWSVNNLEECFTSSMELHSSLHEIAVRSMLNTRTEVSNDRWLSLADVHDYQESMLTLLREREALALLDTPMDAFQQVIQDDVDDQLQSDLIQKIARTMIQQNGYGSFDTLFEYRTWGFRDLLMEEVESQPAEVFSVVQSLPSETRDRFIYSLVSAWTPMDPIAAYEALSSLENFIDGFHYSSVFKIWAEVDLEGLFSRVESFSRIERESAVRSGILALAKTSPEDAANKTFEYESVVGVSVLDLQESLIREWTASDPNAALNWVTENTSEDTWDQAWLFWIGLREFVKIDPKAALELALSQTPESVYVERGFAEQVVSDVVEAGELELAMAALDRIPQNARIDSFSAVGRALALENRWPEAIELIEGFSDEDRIRYFRELTYFAMKDDLFEVLEMVPKLPSEKVRSQVAQAMIRHQERYGDVLTADQISYLRQFVDQNEESNE